MIARAVCAATAVAAAVLTAAAARTWRAEQHYEEGILAVDPATGRAAIDRITLDLPGRLEAYERAADVAPSEPLYSLRVGEIELQRAARSAGPAARDHLRRAEERLGPALDRDPLDPRVHHVLAHCALARRDYVAAERHAVASVRLGPRIPECLEGGARRLVVVWRATSSPGALSGAVHAAALGFELADGWNPELPGPVPSPAVSTVRAFLTGDRSPLEDELLGALAGRPDLLLAAARLLDQGRPQIADTLRQAAASAR